jgi:hypothetical protein
MRYRHAMSPFETLQAGAARSRITQGVVTGIGGLGATSVCVISYWSVTLGV